ncbi:hypothetical protein FS837_000268 [Tulasnella sp. UAMH 9824]|nr:hypothetical protein FS837_000268 [Tulasnella sp. UAMH 9824]
MSLSVGKTCSKLHCGTQDFLPIKCNSCQQTFCREHISIGTGHECQGAPQATGAEQWVARQKCELKGCEKPSLDSAANVGSSDAVSERVPAVCDACGGAFCVREPKSHSCIPTTAVATEDKNAKAKALLAKAFPASKTASSAESAPSGSVTSGTVPNPDPTSSPKPKDPAREARLRKVEVMKMRHQAVPVEAQFARSGATLPPVDKRRFFKARYAGGGETTTTGSVVAYWVSKDVIAGKVVDRLITLLKVAPNTDGHKLEVQGTSVEEERKLVELSRPIGEQVEDGDTLVVVAASKCN